jgi:biotin transport system substrate-specific component
MSPAGLESGAMAIRTPARRMPTLADAAFAGAFEGRAALLARDAALVAAAVTITALAAQISFNVPWTPVPYTGQTAAVLLAGTVLGSRRGLLAMAAYVAVGSLGLPIFSGGASGAGQLIGITGGYLAGFIVAGWLTGALAQRGWDRSVPSAAALMLIGNVAIYALGVPVLAVVGGIGIERAVVAGALVFAPWDAAKIIAASLLLPLTWRMVGRSST